MAFIRTKQHREGGNYYHYLVESYRNELGLPRQRVIKYFGKVTISDATTAHARMNQAAEEFKHMRDIEAAFFGDDDFADGDW